MEKWTLVWCPWCDQGWIHEVRINALDRIVYLCDECDTLWHTPEEIGPEPMESYHHFMRAHGLPDVWSELTILPHINPLVQTD